MTTHATTSAIGAALAIVLSIGLLGEARATAADTVPELDSIDKLRPGDTALLSTKDAKHRMRYFARLPKSWAPKRGARLIVFLHGSSMNGLAYLRSFEQKGWCAGDILVCPNGEQGTDPYGENNFTFGSAPYVAQVTKEVQAALKTTVTYLGGHSQGAFVTYSAILQHPELFHGALPMAGDCWMQNEPNLWEGKPEVLARQKRLAIAVIHGKRDPVVSFSQGEHAYGVFLAMGYPKLRLFAPETLGHEFMLAPVAEALEWLDAMSETDAAARMRAATGWARDKEWGWVTAAAKEVGESKTASSGAKSQSRAALKLAEAAAKKAAAAMAEARASAPAEKWVPEWLEFRRLYGQTEAARPLVETYDKERAAQRAAGARLFAEASSLLRSGDKEKGRAKLREILETAPATYEAYYAVTWLADAS